MKVEVTNVEIRDRNYADGTPYKQYTCMANDLFCSYHTEGIDRPHINKKQFIALTKVKFKEKMNNGIL
jgi:hypothetical protein